MKEEKIIKDKTVAGVPLEEALERMRAYSKCMIEEERFKDSVEDEPSRLAGKMGEEDE